MSNNNTTCVPPDLRKLLSGIIQELDVSSNARSSVLNSIKVLPDCEEPYTKKTKRGSSKEKRAPSAYNVFVGECLRSDAMKKVSPQTKRMSLCAQQWKKRK